MRSPTLILSIAIIILLSVNPGSSIPTVVAPNTPIQHLVVIMQENHSFDNYFGTFPGADGIPPGTCVPNDPGNPSLGCVKPFVTTNANKGILCHTYKCAVADYNGGAMNGFILGEVKNSTMAHYDNQIIPNYWAYAEQYTLADNFYSSIFGYSLPNHWYALAGNSPGVVDKTDKFNDTKYLNQANSVTSVADLLMNSSVSWSYYDLKTGTNYTQAQISGQAFAFWNPLAAKQSTYTTNYAPHFVARTQIFKDISKGKLPQVSWVIPSKDLSEHPPTNITQGMLWTTSIVDAIMQSQYWSSTAIVVTWDDYGGWYDHVPPPTLAGERLGFRVPAIIISPWAKQGFIDHQQYSFESILAFIELNWSTGPLTQRDAQANNLCNAFTFTCSSGHAFPIAWPVQGAKSRLLLPVSAKDLTTIMRLANSTLEED